MAVKASALLRPGNIIFNVYMLMMPTVILQCKTKVAVPLSGQAGRAPNDCNDHNSGILNFDGMHQGGVQAGSTVKQQLRLPSARMPKSRAWARYTWPKIWPHAGTCNWPWQSDKLLLHWVGQAVEGDVVEICNCGTDCNA
jgi:hypothetical protein